MATEYGPEYLHEDSPFPEQAPDDIVHLSDADLEKQSAAKQQAEEFLQDDELEKALDSFTEAIVIGKVSAMLYAKRADVLLKLKRPRACIADCDAAIQKNPDSAKAYRLRGMAHRILSKWQLAHNDLALSQKLDFQDDVVDIQAFVDEQLTRANQSADPRNWVVGATEEKEVVEDFGEEEHYEDDDPAELLEEDPEPFPEKGPVLEDDLPVMQSRKQQDVYKRAVRATEKGYPKKALEILTEAINMGNATAAMYAKRAELSLKLRRPCACISDAGFALEINPDSVKAFRVRGKAYARLGGWEEAHKDLASAQQLDFDDDLVDIQKHVKEKVAKIQEQAAAKRQREEQCFQENLLRRRKQHEERAQREAEAKEAEAHEKAERSLRRRCARCCRRQRKPPADVDTPPASGGGDDAAEANAPGDSQEAPSNDID